MGIDDASAINLRFDGVIHPQVMTGLRNVGSMVQETREVTRRSYKETGPRVVPLLTMIRYAVFTGTLDHCSSTGGAMLEPLYLQSSHQYTEQLLGDRLLEKLYSIVTCVAASTLEYFGGINVIRYVCCDSSSSLYSLSSNERPLV